VALRNSRREVTLYFLSEVELEVVEEEVDGVVEEVLEEFVEEEERSADFAALPESLFAAEPSFVPEPSEDSPFLESPLAGVPVALA
jgi:hypothetical protein